MSGAELSGRKVVVIGASSGVGRGVATRAVRAGADVVVAARRAERLAEVAGGHPVVVDLRDDATCRHLATEVSAVLGRIDLLSPGSVVAVVSSEAAESPRSHLGAYGASKAALEHSVEQWRAEHPWLRLTTVSLGATVPTEFSQGFAADELGEALDAWSAAGLIQAAFMDTEQVCDVLTDMLGSLLATPTVGIPRLTLRSPAPVVLPAGS